MGPVGSIEGPWLVLDPMGVSSSIPRVPWYDFCCLECKNIAHRKNYLLWAICPPPPPHGLFKDSDIPVS